MPIVDDQVRTGIGVGIIGEFHTISTPILITDGNEPLEDMHYIQDKDNHCFIDEDVDTADESVSLSETDPFSDAHALRMNWWCVQALVHLKGVMKIKTRSHQDILDQDAEIYADPSHSSYDAFRFVSGVATTFTPKAGLKIIESYMEGYRQDWGLSFDKDTRTRGGWQQGGIVVAGPGKDNISYIHKATSSALVAMKEFIIVDMLARAV
ncbi:hypothetical protein IFM89_022270 [Coptis chinensis]|uniref:Uncharacterized protein n=1 Tax=Coptis chinensis TaxID=261450 RepID=A0A835LNI1_9MAGN|nr:hypothetical protein IFM89_022270 [Coptis chinensis]